MRKNNQAGFTLIELVMVIVILGALAAIALPKFVDFGTDAKTAAVQGIAGALSSASAINYAERKAKGTGSGVKIADCDDVKKALQSGDVPAGYAITTPAAIAADATKSDCVLTHTASGLTATFTATGIN